MRPRRIPSGFVRFDGEGGGAIVVARPELEPVLRALGLLAEGGLDALWRRAEGLREGGRAPAAVCEMPGRSERLHLRPVRHGGALAPLWRGRVLGPGRALAELEATVRLRERGAPVPRPLLVAAARARPGWRAAVGTVFEVGAEDARLWLRRGPPPAVRRTVAEAAGRAVRAFHDSGGRHADLHVGNLLVRDATAPSPDVLVVDLDRARADGAPGAGRRARELSRLERSLRKNGLLEALGADGVAAFVDGYCAGEPGLRRALAVRWPLERLRIALHAWRYR